MKCGLLGAHLGHSQSPRLHAMLGSYTYELYEVPPEELDGFLRKGDFDALNVTIPYKRAVVPYCAALSDAAKAIGSVNTLRRQSDGTLYGDNTDYDGFSLLLRRNGGIRPGEKALVLGDGGASATVQAVLRDFGARVVVLSRHGGEDYASLPRHADAVLVVNATPVGMYPDNGQRLIDLDALPACRCVLDLVYNPLRTRLILDAEARGIRCEGGLSMLVGQGARACERFTGEAVPESRWEQILCKLQQEAENLILIGMPGCGKSTVGQLLAQKLGRPFFDADEELVKALGCDIPAFFAREGEAAFRERETEMLAELGKRSGCVIATGGGCVTREENYPLLRQNGVLFWLRRDLAALPTEGRPISQSTDLSELYRRRRPLYERFADHIVENDGDPETAADRILALR